MHANKLLTQRLRLNMAGPDTECCVISKGSCFVNRCNNPWLCMFSQTEYRTCSLLTDPVPVGHILSNHISSSISFNRGHSFGSRSLALGPRNGLCRGISALYTRDHDLNQCVYMLF